MAVAKTKKRHSPLAPIFRILSLIPLSFLAYLLTTGDLLPTKNVPDPPANTAPSAASSAAASRPRQEPFLPTEKEPLPTGLLLVNGAHLLPEGYDIELTMLPEGEGIHSLAYPYLEQMFKAARGDGVYPIVVSGFRTLAQQQSILNDYIASYMAEGYSRSNAEKMAAQWVAQPGSSEHHLGFAVDINADPARSTNRDVYLWLADNAHRFGFILRYPDGKTDVTGIGYEPWHYRFVGMEQAAAIHAFDGCLEEYVAAHAG